MNGIMVMVTAAAASHTAHIHNKMSPEWVPRLKAFEASATAAPFKAFSLQCIHILMARSG